MYNAHYQRGRIHTNEHSLLFLSWGKEIYQISIVPKQTQINAFYNYVCKLWVCGAKLLHFFDLRKRKREKYKK